MRRKFVTTILLVLTLAIFTSNYVMGATYANLKEIDIGFARIGGLYRIQDTIYIIGNVHNPGGDEYDMHGEIRAYDDELKLKWKEELDGTINANCLADDAIYLDSWGELYKFDLNGNKQWQVNVEYYFGDGSYDINQMALVEDRLYTVGNFSDQSNDGSSNNTLTVVTVSTDGNKVERLFSDSTFYKEAGESLGQTYDVFRMNNKNLYFSHTYTKTHDDPEKYYVIKNGEIQETIEQNYEDAKNISSIYQHSVDVVKKTYSDGRVTIESTNDYENNLLTVELSEIDGEKYSFTSAVITDSGRCYVEAWDFNDSMNVLILITDFNFNEMAGNMAESIKQDISLDFDELEELTEINDIIEEVEKTVESIEGYDLGFGDNIEELTDYVEKAIVQGSSEIIDIAVDNLDITHDFISEDVDHAIELTNNVDSVLADAGIELNRKIETEVNVVVSNHNERINFNFDKSIATSDVDKVTVETNYVNISADSVFRDKNEDVTITVTIEKISATASGLPTDDLYIENGVLSKGLVGVKKLKRGEPIDLYKITFKEDAEEVDKTDGKLIIGLDVSSDEGDFDSIFIEREDGSIEALGGNYNKKTGKVEIKTNESGTYYITQNKKSFSDISGLDESTKEAIEVLAAKGMINGKSESIFDPSGTISRAEFTKIIIRALYLTDWSAPNTFTDVSDSAWYKPYVASSKQEGLINGYEDGTFKPSNIISKQEMVKICSASLHEQKGYHYPTSPDQYLGIYSDEIVGWVEQYLALAEREGIVVNSSSGLFEGSKGTTRADAAVMLFRLFKRL